LIAIAAHGYEGISWGKLNQVEADRAAMASCTKAGGKDCKVVFQYHNPCAALAFAKGAVHYTTATEATEAKAKAVATTQCRRQYGICLTDLSACSP
jgi:hypothetical protein